MSIASALADIKAAIQTAQTVLQGAYRPRGVWNSATAYSPGPPADLVRLTGTGAGVYAAIAASTNVNPNTDVVAGGGVVGTSWALIAQDGATGATGSTGSTGATGKGYVNRGAWAASTAYSPLDFVFTGTSPNEQTWICLLAHTSGTTFAAGNNWAPGAVQGPSGMAVMTWNGASYVKTSDGTTGRPATASYPGGTVFYIGPNQPTDAATNDVWFNLSAP